MKNILRSRALKIIGLYCSIAIFISAAAIAQETIPAQTALNGIDPQTAQAIESYVKGKMVKLHSPGMAVGIVKGSTLIYEGYFGWADIEAKKPVGESTIFRIGSISKTMTTIGLMQQWELGKFKLDDNLNNYFPRPLIFPPHPDTRPVSFRYLLTHTSGGGEYLTLRQIFTPGLGYIVEGENYLPLIHYLRFGMKTKYDPGLKYAYCNYGFAFLGYALENIAKEPFHIYQKKHIFEPLCMRDTDYHHNAQIMSRLANGYRYKDGRYVLDPHKAIGITPAGSVYTDIREMALYVTALLNGGKNENGSVIKPETLDMLFSTQFTLDPRQAGRGIGFMVFGDNLWGYRVVGHGGQVPFGFNSEMFLVPGEKVGVIVFSNAGNVASVETAWGVLKMALDVKDNPPPEVTPNRKVWPELVGYYRPEYPEFRTDTRLYMSGIGAYRVRRLKNDLVMEYVWQGKKTAKKLHQVGETDPYFFWYDSPNDEIRPYVAFKKKENGKMYIIPGGLNEYVKLGPIRKCKTKMMIPPGRMLDKINPF